MPEYDIHPAAELFPMMDDAKLRELSDDIKKNGLRENLMRWGGEHGPIVDGRNRLKACEMAGVIPRFDYIHASVCDDPVAYVVSLNLHRRHLTEAQRCSIAAELTNMKQGDNRYSIDPPDGGSIVSQKRAAELMNVSVRSVQRAAAVRRAVAPDLVAAVERGDLTLTTADRIVKDNPEDHDAQVNAMSEPARKPPSKPELPDSGRRTRSCVGVPIARQAISLLETIPKSDKERKDGYALVREWLENQRRKRR
jgi:hypothetical protein